MHATSKGSDGLHKPSRRRFLFSLAGIAAITVLPASALRAQTAGQIREGLGYPAKYAPDFAHFDYVNPNATRDGRLAMSVFGTFDSLNPFVLKGLSAMGSARMPFDSLVVRSWDEPFSVYGLLADQLALAADGLSVVYRLNAAARFADGSPVTAEDVVFTFELLVSEQAHPRYRQYWSDVAGVDALDERHVRFRFVRENPELHLVVGEMPVFARHAVNAESFADLARDPIMGSGPYEIIDVNYGRNITFARRPDYWAQNLNTRRGFYNFAEVEFKYYRDHTIALEAFFAGEFDVFHETNSKRWARSYTGRGVRDGLIHRREIPHENNAGMQGFAMNTRRSIFSDRRVRRAMTLAFDFNWSNVHLFYGQYERCYSYFSNSELAARGVPEGEELALLTPFADQLPPELFTQPHVTPFAANPEEQRQNMIEARDLLKEAGWNVVDGVLRNQEGRAFRFDIMLAQRGFERIVAPYAYNLRRLGIDVRYRTLDLALYQRRMDEFDFDMTVIAYGQSQSPGNEIRDMFSSDAAKRPGSRNFCGIANPVVDKLLDEVIYAPNRERLVVAARALDRVLMWNEYMVPNWYTSAHRLAWWNRFAYQDQPLPRFFNAHDWIVQTWWQTDTEAQPGPVVEDISNPLEIEDPSDE
ncbi:MAG TPA: ABC transporter substrate-binding protein [Halothiobacillaceae bacterium]|nr:ABC transporter substrate-binding protein [Halothiobacillaceae bacterium]